MSDLRDLKVGFGSSDGREPQEARGPLRVVVVSGVCARPDLSARARPALDPIAIDKLSFDEVMGKIGPALTIAVSDPFTAGAEPLRVELRWTDQKSMRPDALADQVAPLRALVEARAVVLGVRQRRVTPDDARAQLGRILPRSAWADALASDVVKQVQPATNSALTLPAPATTPPGPGKHDPLDALFEKVAVKGPEAPERPERPERPEPAEVSGLSAIVAAVARGGRPSASRPPVAVGSALDRVERAFTHVLTEILRHPEVRRLEQAWRGLRLVVDHADARAGVEIDVIPAQKDEVEEALHALLSPRPIQSQRAPVDLVVVDHAIGASFEDTSAFAAWAKIAEELHAPIAVNGHPSLLGIESIEALPRAGKRLRDMADPRPDNTRAASAEEPSRWAALVMNGMLVRPAYTPSTSRLREIPFTEDAADKRSLVFAGPALAIAILCAQSYAKYGWPTAILGAREGQVQNLPLHEIEEAGETIATPLEVFVRDDVIREAARLGVIVLGCAPNHDAAVLTRAPVFYKPGKGPAESTLPDQLFVGRFASAVEQVAAAIPAGVDPAKGARAACAALKELFVDAPPNGPEVKARIAARRLEVTVLPHRYAGVSIEQFTLGAPLSG